jgi:hypothetical protein
MVHVRIARLSFALTRTSVGGGAEEPPLPRQPVKNMAEIATMLNPEYRFIFNHSQ